MGQLYDSLFAVLAVVFCNLFKQEMSQATKKTLKPIITVAFQTIITGRIS